MEIWEFQEDRLGLGLSSTMGDLRSITEASLPPTPPHRMKRSCSLKSVWSENLKRGVAGNRLMSLIAEIERAQLRALSKVEAGGRVFRFFSVF